MNNIIKSINAEYLKKKKPDFRSGDIVKVSLKIIEGDKSRIQHFEGIVIRRKNSGVGESFTVRRVSFGEGVERTFLLNSPIIDKIKVVSKGNARRSKLYYLREKSAKEVKFLTNTNTVHTDNTKSEEAKEIKEVKEAKEVQK